MRTNPKARRAKSKKRLRQFEEPNPGRIPCAQRAIRSHPACRASTVIEVEHLRRATASVADRRPSFRLPPGGIVGIIGPNGAGKTIAVPDADGVEPPDAGTVRIGPSVKLAAVDQSRDSLDDSKTVWEEISGGPDLIQSAITRPLPAATWRFNFRGGQQQQRIGELSGGERNSVHRRSS